MNIKQRKLAVENFIEDYEKNSDDTPENKILTLSFLKEPIQHFIYTGDKSELETAINSNATIAAYKNYQTGKTILESFSTVEHDL